MEARVMTSAAAQPPGTASKVMAYLVPANGLWPGAVSCLEPQNCIIQQLASQNDVGNPAAGVISFGPREL